MKKKFRVLLSFLLLLNAASNLLAQTGKKNGVDLSTINDSSNQEAQSKQVIRTANDLKTGNWQDVLSSFFQLSLSDLTGNNKALNFKSTIFAIKAKADSSLLIDRNYVHQTFARNFQFDFSLKLDSQYRFTGFQGGFTWAIINKRDSTVMSLVNTLIDSIYLLSVTDLQNAFINFSKSVSDSSGNIKKDKLEFFKDIKKKVQDAVASSQFVLSKDFPPEFRPFLKPYTDKGYDENLKRATSLFNDKLAALRAKPLLTLSANSTFKNDQQAFNNGEVQIVYLQGIKSKSTSTELDIRSSINVKDTIVVTTMRRSVFKASAGINFSLFQGNAHKSIIEFKPYLEYQSILSTTINNEKKDLFTANADLRIRITDNLWIPFTLKYDVKKGNFLGFLNVALNMNAFKMPKS